MGSRTLVTNRKAFRDFAISQKWECGIALKGGEVKSLREGNVNFKDSFARVEEGEVYLHNLHIQPYKESSYLNEEPDRVRKLLLHKREIRKLEAAVNEKNFILVPTKIYFNSRGLVKIELALGKGKKLYDKREDMKKKTIERALKQSMRMRQKR